MASNYNIGLTAVLLDLISMLVIVAMIVCAGIQGHSEEEGHCSSLITITNLIH